MKTLILISVRFILFPFTYYYVEIITTPMHIKIIYKENFSDILTIFF